MRWIICFSESKNIGIWKYFTKHRFGFSHVYAVSYDSKIDIWKKLEFTTHGFNSETLTGEDSTKLVLDMHMCNKCIEIDIDKNPIYMPRLFYCVSFIKHLCNIRKFWILTPYQLYCELLKRNGNVIFEAKELLEAPNG